MIMKSNSGIVMQLDKKHAFIMTETGEFLKVKLNRNVPKIGEVFTGEISSKNSFYKYAAAAASLIFVLLSGSGAYAYYSPSASIIVSINPSVKLQVNKWDRVIKSIPLNEDGTTLLHGLNLKNNSLNSALDKIIDESKKDNFINKEYIESGKTITIAVEDNKLKKEFNLSEFEEHAKKSNLNIKIINKQQDESSIKENKKSKTTDEKDIKSNNVDSNSHNIPSNVDNDNSKGKSSVSSPTEVPKNNNSLNSKKNADKNNGNIKKDGNDSKEYDNSSKNNNSDKHDHKEKIKGNNTKEKNNGKENSKSKK